MLVVYELMAACLLTAADSCMCRYTKMDWVKCHQTLALCPILLEKDGIHTPFKYQEHKLIVVYLQSSQLLYIQSIGIEYWYRVLE